MSLHMTKDPSARPHSQVPRSCLSPEPVASAGIPVPVLASQVPPSIQLDWEGWEGCQHRCPSLVSPTCSRQLQAQSGHQLGTCFIEADPAQGQHLVVNDSTVRCNPLNPSGPGQQSPGGFLARCCEKHHQRQSQRASSHRRQQSGGVGRWGSV